jgi:hypothetical protein
MFLNTGTQFSITPTSTTRVLIILAVKCILGIGSKWQKYDLDSVLCNCIRIRKRHFGCASMHWHRTPYVGPPSALFIHSSISQLCETSMNNMHGRYINYTITCTLNFLYLTVLSKSLNYKYRDFLYLLAKFNVCRNRLILGKENIGTETPPNPPPTWWADRELNSLLQHGQRKIVHTCILVFSFVPSYLSVSTCFKCMNVFEIIRTSNLIISIHCCYRIWAFITSLECTPICPVWTFHASPLYFRTTDS